MRRMKLPRFSLRTLLILVALVAIPMSWVAYQLNWIRQRHEFLQREGVVSKTINMDRPFPWGLRLLGEQKQYLLDVPQDDGFQNVLKLFPEAVVNLRAPTHR